MTKTITTIRDLSNEIIFDIFDYFWAVDLFHSFSCVFPRLLTDRLLGLRVRLTSHNNEFNFIDSILPRIDLQQIVSLSLVSLHTTLPISSLTNLRSFSLEHGSTTNSSDDYQSTLEELERLPALKYLSFEIGLRDAKMASDILRMTFNKSSVRRLYFRAYADIQFPISETMQSTSILYITLRGIWQWINVIDLLRCVPNVRTVHLVGITVGSLNSVSLLLPNVRRLIVRNCFFWPFENLLNFIRTMVPNLYSLQVLGDLGGNHLSNYLDGKKWQELFELKINQKNLHKIKIDITFYLQKKIDAEGYLDRFALDAHFHQIHLDLNHNGFGLLRLRN